MEEIEYSGLLVDRCIHCGGIWFDAGVFTYSPEITFLDKIKNLLSPERSCRVCPFSDNSIFFSSYSLIIIVEYTQK